MCLATPMQVTKIDGQLATVKSAGTELTVGLDLLDEVSIGDYVIVHAGFAIQQLSAAEAHETLAILERLEASWSE